MRRTGFTLIEGLLTLAILGVITGVSVPMYMRYSERSCLSQATDQATAAIARARLLSQLAEQDSGWGFSLDHGVLFKGATYATRDAAYDETYALGTCFTYSGLSEISFEKGTGDPQQNGAISLEGNEYVASVEVAQDGTVITGSDEFVICHIPPGNPENAHTIMVSENSWPAHQAHGDTSGACPNSSSSSSQASSSSAPSAPEGGQSCTDRFFVDEDGALEITGPGSATISVLGSQITYGVGGPEVSVTLESSTDSGDHWSNLFNNQDVNGGEQETLSDLSSGNRVVLRFRAKYKSLVNRRYQSNDTTGHIYVLRDGDALPPYTPFDNKHLLESFLQDVIDDTYRINIGAYDALFLVEFDNLDDDTSDFQDAVVLVSFEQEAGSCN